MSQPEQRQYNRLRLVGTNIKVVDIESGIEFDADGADLSGKGLKFCAPMEPAVGADLHVRLTGMHPSTPPLDAEMRVLRVAPRGDGFEVAGQILRAS